MLRIPLSLTAALVGLALCISSVAAEAQAPATSDLRLTAVALNVADLARSEKYYTTVLGLSRVMQIPAEGTPIEFILSRTDQAGSMSVILAHFDDNPLPEGKARYGRIVVITEDAKAVVKRAADAGYKTPSVPTPGPNAPLIVFLEDPDGYQIELYQAPSGG